MRCYNRGAVKVATRLTLATAVVVTLASSAYAVFDVRARGAERQAAALREARTLALGLRVAIEARGLDLARADALGRDLGRAVGRWRVALVDPAGLELAGAAAPDPARPLAQPVPPGQLRRVRAILGAPEVLIAERDDAGVHAAISIRRAGTSVDTTSVVAVLLVWREAGFLADAASDDWAGALGLVVLIVAVATLVVGALSSSLVSGRIRKLLRGIDDVAKGDLSHVLLSDRDDEIGALATRFNEMTFSLRESRAETERQNQAKLDLEQRLGQTEKLATIGQLAAEIAHEVGTPLNVIAGRARSVQKKAGDREAVEKNAVIIAEQTARITRIIQRLLDFARRKVGAAPRAAVSLNEVTLTTMELLAGQFSSHRVKTRLSRAEGLPRVAGDADRLQQVLINLVLNGVQAMAGGGTLEVETSRSHRHRPGLEDAPAQDFVVVAVSDTGAGIPADVRDKIFDPFFTTKEGSGGTGLGLAVCSGIVKEHDGWMEVDDRAGGGTVFRVFIPAAPALGAGAAALDAR